MDLIIRFILGGTMVTIVTVLANRGMPFLAGIIMVFPVITFVSFLFIDENRFISVARAGLLGLLLTGVYIFMMVIFYKLTRNRYHTLALASAVWLVLTAAVVFFVKPRF